MKTAVWCLLFLAARVGAQTIPDELVDRLATDLSALRNLPNPNGERLRGFLDLTRSDLTALRSFVSQQAPEQNRAMTRFVDDIADRYGKVLIPWDVAYALTSALAGRELPDEMLKQLSSSFVLAIDSTVSCRDTRSSLRKSVKFRAALESMNNSLVSLGVHGADALVVLESLSTAGLRIADPNAAGPVVKPIPPYQPRSPATGPLGQTIVFQSSVPPAGFRRCCRLSVPPQVRPSADDGPPAL